MLWTNQKLPVYTWINIPWHLIPASSEWEQLLVLVLKGQSKIPISLPLQLTEFRNTDPIPAPKWALLNATAPIEKCLQIMHTTQIQQCEHLSYHLVGIQVVCTLLQHQCHPIECHRQFPKCYLYIPPPCLHSRCFHLPVLADQWYKELQNQRITLVINVITIVVLMC